MTAPNVAVTFQLLSHISFSKSVELNGGSPFGLYEPGINEQTDMVLLVVEDVGIGSEELEMNVVIVEEVYKLVRVELVELWKYVLVVALIDSVVRDTMLLVEADPNTSEFDNDAVELSADDVVQ